MRVLINGLSARLGGGQTYLRNLLKHAPPEWRIFLLCPDNFDRAGLPDTISRVETPVLENPFARAIWEYANLPALATKLEANVLFSPGGLLPARALPGQVKTAVTFQNMLPFDKEQRKRYHGYRWFRDWLLERGFSSAMRKADLVIFISRYAEQVMQLQLGTLRGKRVVIPHGIAPEFFPGKPLPFPQSVPQSPYALYVSYIDFYKSQIEVVRAFARVRERGKAPEHLLLAGAENPLYGALLRQEIKNLRLKDTVHILGNVPHRDLPALYQHATLNLFASCTENCPNILLEMMASGRPALVSSRGPMPEFGNKFVHYFDPGNVEELAAQWMTVQSQPDLARDMAIRAMEHVAPMTWEHAARQTWQAIAGIA